MKNIGTASEKLYRNTLITDNIIADTMESVQRNACIYGPIGFAAAMIHMRLAGDKITNLNYAKALSASLREEWVTLRETLLF